MWCLHSILPLNVCADHNLPLYAYIKSFMVVRIMWTSSEPDLKHQWRDQHMEREKKNAYVDNNNLHETGSQCGTEDKTHKTTTEPKVKYVKNKKSFILARLVFTQVNNSRIQILITYFIFSVYRPHLNKNEHTPYLFRHLSVFYFFVFIRSFRCLNMHAPCLIGALLWERSHILFGFHRS